MKHPVAIAFGQTLRETRRAAGLSQAILAERAELDTTTPSLYERGLRQPTMSSFFRLATALGTNPETLVTRTRMKLAARGTLPRNPPAPWTTPYRPRGREKS